MLMSKITPRCFWELTWEMLFLLKSKRDVSHFLIFCWIYFLELACYYLDWKLFAIKMPNHWFFSGHSLTLSTSVYKKQKLIRSDSIIASRPEDRWVYTFFVILRDGKLGRGWGWGFGGVGWYLIKVRDVSVKKFNEIFWIIKEKIA